MSEKEDQERAQREQAARDANAKRIADRLERLNSIANQADERKAADGMEDLDDEAWSNKAPANRREEEESDPTETIADAEQADRELDEARAAGADDVRVTNGETYYRVIVNGNEKWLTLSQLRETSSKVSAADEYLRTAKEAAKTAVMGLTPSPQGDESGSTAPGRVRDLLTRALMGEQEAIDEFARRLEGPSTTDVLKAVDERVDGRLTFRQAVDWFDREYAEELKNPRLKAMMVSRDAELAAHNPDMDFKQRLKQVGDEIRDLRRELAGTVAPRTPERNDKEARKASVRAIPTAGGRLSEDSDDDDDETYESAIAKMASARGQHRPVVHKRN